MVVEFKCSEQEWEHDENKLKCLTTPKTLRENNNQSTPFYKLGAFVYLADNKENVQIRIYENGTDVTNNDTYNKILKGFKYA